MFKTRKVDLHQHRKRGRSRVIFRQNRLRLQDTKIGKFGKLQEQYKKTSLKLHETIIFVEELFLENHPSTFSMKTLL